MITQITTAIRQENHHENVGTRLSSQREPGQQLRFIAHQGAQGTYPTNSLPALEVAFGVADCVEFDVYIANRQDGSEEVVAIHPEGYFLYVNPNPMQNEKPLPMTFEQTREYQVSGKPLIPTIDEIIDVYVKRCNETGKRSELHIELKGPGTAEVVLPILHKRIERGELSYEDFALTGLSYPGDRGRLVVARHLDPKVRLVFVARGGDYGIDGFQGLEDAIDFAKSIGADTFTVARRGLPPGDIARIREAGFRVGTFHCRTSDEAEAAVSLGAEYVAADFFEGASILSYPDARIDGCPIYHQLNQIGFFHMRDWIWEIGWEAEKSSELGQKLWAFPYVVSKELESSGGVYICASGEIILRWAEKGEVTGDWIDYSQVPISEKFIRQGGADDVRVRAWRELLSADTVIEDAMSVVHALSLGEAAIRLLGSSDKNELVLEDIVSVAEHQNESDNSQDLAVREVARQVLTRYGRLLGTVAFTALRPRHGARDSYSIVIESPDIRFSHWIRRGAEQQVAAQGLRSGKRCVVTFVSSLEREPTSNT